MKALNEANQKISSLESELADCNRKLLAHKAGADTDIEQVKYSISDDRKKPNLKNP
jgi:hypothetical protein